MCQLVMGETKLQNFESNEPIASQNDSLFLKCSKHQNLVTPAGQNGVDVTKPQLKHV